MKTATIAAALCLGLTGCASMEYIVKNYNDVPVVEHTTSYDTFRVFDKPREGRMMITSSIGAAAAGGFAKGLTFGASGTVAPKPVYQEAVESYLAKTGRACRVTDGTLLADPQWEFRYECAPATAQAPAAPLATGATRR